LEKGLPVSEITLADLLKNEGYATMAIGKWHLGAHESQRPLKRGFDEFFGFLTGGHRYFPEDWVLDDISGVNSQYAAYNTKLLKNDSRVDEKEYLTDALSREAVDFVARNAHNPFFLYLAYNAPHTPLQATEKYLNRFNHISDKKRKIYAAMVSSVDDGVGKLLDKLVELGIHEHTMVFFLSDNGGPYKTNGSNNYPLREGKGSLYEGGVRVPFALQWPQKVTGGKKYDHPIISLDIFATAAEYAGIEPKNELDGKNIIPFINDETTGVPHEQLFWRKFDAEQFAVRSAENKLLGFKEKGLEFYNLAEDISEKNILGENAKSQQINAAYENWLKQMKDPIFLGLMQNDEYNKTHPDRFKIKPY
jgi:arylsulfatase A-like enzyme